MIYEDILHIKAVLTKGVTSNNIEKLFKVDLSSGLILLAHQHGAIDSTYSYQQWCKEEILPFKIRESYLSMIDSTHLQWYHNIKQTNPELFV